MSHVAVYEAVNLSLSVDPFPVTGAFADIGRSLSTLLPKLANPPESGQPTSMDHPDAELIDAIVTASAETKRQEQEIRRRLELARTAVEGGALKLFREARHPFFARVRLLDFARWAVSFELEISDELKELPPKYNCEIASRRRINGLQKIILLIMQQEPEASTKAVEVKLRNLDHRTIDSVTILSITDDEIEWCDTNDEVRTTPLSGLKDRVTRARKILRSTE